jgi:predicted MFS family arabinose efflux permease
MDQATDGALGVKKGDAKKDEAKNDDASQKIPLGVQVAVYATGTFANSTNNVVSVILPLWAVAIGASPFMIGIILGARHFLTALLSIHGGALMDRIGTRRVLVWFGVAAAISPILFPLMPWVWGAVVLQMIGGLATNYGWIGAQAQIGEIMKGHAVYAGRFSFSLRFGQLAAPPLAGFAWDVAGPWAGFGLLTLWGVGLLISSMALPRSAGSEGTGPVRARDLLPRLSDYIDAFRLMAVPAILLVVMVTVLRMGGNGIQSSFYVVYLGDIGYSGTLIGVLLGAAGVLGFAGALSVEPLTRLMQPYWLLIVTVASTILFVAATPLISGIFVLLLAASALRGGAMGLSQPLMISILARAAGDKKQGKGAGLRTTANRLSSMLVPVVMGGVVEAFGIEASFYIIGAVLIGLMGLVALHVNRTLRA